MSVNPQRVLRTGDVVLNTATGRQGSIHYVVEKDGQITFEGVISNLSGVLLYNGDNIVKVDITNIETPRRKK